MGRETKPEGGRDGRKAEEAQLDRSTPKPQRPGGGVESGAPQKTERPDR